MLQETVCACKGWTGLKRRSPSPTTSTASGRRAAARDSSRPAQALVLEPAGRGTAAAAAAAALMLPEKDAVMLVMAADHAIGNLPRFHAAIRTRCQACGPRRICRVRGTCVATAHRLRLHQAGNACDEAFIVERFVEKPNLETAKAFLAAGGYFWNSGIFVFRADRYLAELERHRPDVVEAVKQAMAARSATPTSCARSATHSWPRRRTRSIAPSR